MFQFVPQARYAAFLGGITTSGLVSEQEVQRMRLADFAPLQRAVVHSKDETIDQALIYCPTYLYKNRYGDVLKQASVSDAVVVELLRGGLEVLRVAAVQAHFKQIPLIIADLALADALQSYCDVSCETANGSREVGKSGGIVVLNQAQIQALLNLCLENSFCGPITDKQGAKFELLQVDLPIEFTAISGLMARAFQDDPTWSVIQPNPLLKEQIVYHGCYNIAKGTATRGMNYLVVDSKNIFTARAGLLASPPGHVRGFWGSEVGFALAAHKGGLSVLDLPATVFLETFHRDNCGALDNHVYVGWISCAAGQNSQGIGSALMRIAVNIADQCEAFLYLENSKEKNLGFYHKMGLQVVQQYALTRKAYGKATGYAMRRPVRGKGSEELRAADYKEQEVAIVLKHSCGH